MHSSEKRLILLHSTQNKKHNKNALSEKQNQLEVLQQIEIIALFLKLN